MHDYLSAGLTCGRQCFVVEGRPPTPYKMLRIGTAAAVGLLVMFLFACSQRSSGPDSEYCGHSFCISGVMEKAVTVTMPVIDVRRYEIQVPNGLLIMVESNFPDVEGAEQSPATELPNLRAWHLSPAAHPACLILVGAKWPHWMIAWIEGKEANRDQLVEYLKRVRITATPNTTMEGIQTPAPQKPKSD